MRKSIPAAIAVTSVGLLAACGTTPPAATEGDAYPERAISIIVPVPAGSSTDISTRFLVPCLEEELDGSIVVENREGGGGAVGNGLFARAEADGYTLAATAVGNAVVPPITEGNVGYDASSFLPIGMIGSSPTVLVVRADSPYQSAEDLLGAAENERIIVGIPGPTSVPGISLSALREQYELQLEGVPFTGNGNTIQALLSGEAQAAYLSADGGVVLPRIESGEIIALASAVPETRETLPGVPTLHSLGYEDLPNGDSFWFLATQVGTPQPIVDELEAAMETCMSDGSIKDQIGEGVAPDTFVGSAATKEILDEAAAGYEDLLQ